MREFGLKRHLIVVAEWHSATLPPISDFQLEVLIEEELAAGPCAGRDQCE
jgi:hypothetical protein